MGEAVEDKYKLLVVDDEKNILLGFEKGFGDQFRILTANSGEEALQLIETDPAIGVIVTDQRMPGMTGVQLLQQVKTHYPEKVRVLITGYTDLNSAVNAINEGDVYRYIQKPIEEEKTLEILSDALGHYTENLAIRKSIEDVKNRIRDRFIQIYESVASGIAHHINNGLVPTKTFYDLLPKKVEALKDGKYDEEFFKDFYNQAAADVDCVQQIVAMFTWVRNCKVEDFQPVKVETLLGVENIEVQKYVKENKLEVVKEIEDGLPDVVVEPLKAQEMLMLLIKNCAKEAPKGSKLHIKAVKETKNTLPHVNITISRSGPSYPSEEIPRLFDPFYKFDKSLKDGVSGLDLTNCFIIAAKHGSEIKVKSIPNAETSFSISLPASS